MTAATKVTVRLTWERLGRGKRAEGTVEEVTVRDGPDFGDNLADVIFRIAKANLASSWFDVSVYTDGGFSIEAGRFGRGRWERLS